MYEYYLPLSEDERKAIWGKGLIVFDTNIILDLYRINKKDSDQLFLNMSSEKIKN